MHLGPPMHLINSRPLDEDVLVHIGYLFIFPVCGFTSASNIMLIEPLR